MFRKRNWREWQWADVSDWTREKKPNRAWHAVMHHRARIMSFNLVDIFIYFRSHTWPPCDEANEIRKQIAMFWRRDHFKCFAKTAKKFLASSRRLHLKINPWKYLKMGKWNEIISKLLLELVKGAARRLWQSHVATRCCRFCIETSNKLCIELRMTFECAHLISSLWWLRRDQSWFSCHESRWTTFNDFTESEVKKKKTVPTDTGLHTWYDLLGSSGIVWTKNTIYRRPPATHPILRKKYSKDLFMQPER